VRNASIWDDDYDDDDNDGGKESKKKKFSKSQNPQNFKLPTYLGI
jgi:hypothetical protein